MIRRFNQSYTQLCVVSLLVSSLLVACGESDLESLQLQEIENAQSQLDETPQPGEALGDVSEVDSLIENATLIFSDEFEGGELDSSLWNTAMAWGPSQSINEEQQFYVDSLNDTEFGYEPFGFNAGNLSIQADYTPSALLADASQQPYVSGVLTTRNKFSFTYGYAEIRAQLPLGTGLWPGFWLLGESYEARKPQLFAMEARGDNTGLIYHRYNYNNDENVFQYSDLLRSKVDDFTTDFHTYGVAWKPGELIFYVDGERTHTFTSEGVSEQDMYLILSLAVGGWFPGDADQTTLLPAAFVIDHVRVYSLPGN